MLLFSIRIVLLIVLISLIPSIFLFFALEGFEKCGGEHSHNIEYCKYEAEARVSGVQCTVLVHALMTRLALTERCILMHRCT